MQRSTFAGFNTAWTAINASQRWLDITGQNISNINTNGYTRQIVNQQSLYSTGHDKYVSRNNPQTGNGVLVSGISQVRNDFLDVRFRNEICKVGEQNVAQSALNDIQNIFDESSVDGLAANISEFIKQLNQLAQNSGSSEYDSMVKSAATALVQQFNKQANALDGIREEKMAEFEDVEVTQLNDTIQRITELNKTIKNNQIHGSPCLELLDQRNSLLDELATYANVSITNMEHEVSPGTGVYVNNLEVTMKDSDGKTHKIIDGEKGASFSITAPTAGDPKTHLTLKELDGTSTDVTDLMVSGTLKGYLDLLNEGGEFTGSTTRGIPYYEKRLDSLAKEFADGLNTINKAGWEADKTPGQNLFEPDGYANITAKNLKIAQGWTDGSYGVATSRTDPSNWVGDNSGDNDNVLKMVDFFKQSLTFEISPGGTGPAYYNGTLQEAFSSMSNTLALDVKAAESRHENFSNVINGISDLRDGISGVSLDEEGINLMHYQRSLTAASRLMNALDEAVNTIINMGVVGR